MQDNFHDNNSATKCNHGSFYTPETTSLHSPSTIVADCCKVSLKGRKETLDILYSKSRSGYVRSCQGKEIRLLQQKHSNAFDMNIDHKHLATLRFTNNGSVTVVVANTSFYTYTNWSGDLEFFIANGGFQYSNIRELHIAYDTHGIFDKVNKNYIKKKYQLPYKKKFLGMWKM